jgi:hypothetical protein
MAWRSRCSIGLVAGLITAAASTVAAHATTGVVAASWTPLVTSADATVQKLVQCGPDMYAVGSFSQVKQGGRTYIRHDAFSFSATTGSVTAWNPNVSGYNVGSIALNRGCGIAYLGGEYTRVGSTRAANLAAVSTVTGRVIPGFGRQVDGPVDTVALINSGRDLMVGGAFAHVNGRAKALYASVDPTTGAVNSYFSAAVTGKLPGTSSAAKVYNQQVSPSGTRLLFEGDFTAVGGHKRLQVVELDLGPAAATLDAWSNPALSTGACLTGEEFYGRSAAFSPDERTIYLAATGFNGTSPFCDAVTAFTNTAPATVKWINKTGHDSLYAVAASAKDVYIGGHERWADNPQGKDDCGPGCVSRPGIGDISAITGRATPWNPTRSRGHGSHDLVITAAGLWVASDTFFNSVTCAGDYHPGICFFPGAA